MPSPKLCHLNLLTQIGAYLLLFHSLISNNELLIPYAQEAVKALTINLIAAKPLHRIVGV